MNDRSGKMEAGMVGVGGGKWVEMLGGRSKIAIRSG